MIELGKGLITGGVGADIIATGKGVAGINAEPYAGFILDVLDDCRQMFKAESQVGALACGVFDDCRYALSGIESDIDRLGNACQTVTLINLF